jgi:LysM repeat protein
MARLVQPLVTIVTATGIVAASLVALAPSASAMQRWPGHPDRAILVHRVRPGDTATGLAVRYHAWTRELLRLNHLGRHATLYVGERVRIPVVLSAVRRAHPRPVHRPVHRAPHHSAPHHSAPHHRPRWTHATLSRPQVGRAIAATARAHRVPPRLAQAIGWQESGWYQPVVSSAGAVGVMQLLPSTGRWMEAYVGRPLRLRDTYDNVLAGVVLLRVLRANTHNQRQAIAAYYQGLGAVQQHGLYRDTRHYVRSVRAIERHLQAGWQPR